MTQTAAINTLSRLLLIQHRSLSMFLSETSPWLSADAEKAAETLENITIDQREFTGRLVRLLQDLGGRVEFGSYPIVFTDMHFLSLQYLMGELNQRQRRVIPAVQACVAALDDGSPARLLADEILGAEKAHLEALDQLVNQPAA
jgi:hypothetical protein